MLRRGRRFLHAMGASVLTKNDPIGYIGLGAMGEPMARCLLRAGFTVRASAHKRRDALERLRGEGLLEVADPAEVAAQSKAVVVCVPDSPQVLEVFNAPRGLFAGAKPSSFFIDMSTISPVTSRELAAAAQERGCGFIDAPVSGGPARAAPPRAR